MIIEILTGSGGSLSYLQDVLGGILSSSTKKGGGGDSVRGDFVLHSLNTSYSATTENENTCTYKAFRKPIKFGI